MHLLHLTFLHFMLTFFASETTLENSLVSPTKNVKTITFDDASKSNAKPGATNIIYQSMDGGKTWQDISYTLPENEEPALYAGEAGLYLRYKDKMYYSKSNLKTPVWETESKIDPQYVGDHPFDGSIIFNPSGVMAYGWNVQVYQNKTTSGGGTWSPVYPTLKEVVSGTRRNWLFNIVETSDGTIFVGAGAGLYKSTDKGKSWKHVYTHGGVVNLVESEGVLIATSFGGIMRSTDNGEHWFWAIRDGGAGIQVERIDGGFAAISYNNTTKLRSMHASFDAGKTWTNIDAGLSPSRNISSIKQIGNYLICGHADGIFRSSDKGKTWVMVHGSVDNTTMASSKPRSNVSSNGDERLFGIYVSGNVVYAVARRSGC